MTRLTGCGTALVTPMGKDGSVDHGALERLVDWQIEEGIHFLVAIGSTGEAATLTPGERREVVETVVRAAGGRVPIVAGATSNDTAAAVREARAVVEAGADQVLSATPYYNKPPKEGLRRHFEAICRAAERPVILYNVPGRTGLNMTAEVTLDLAEIEGVIGVKEASGDLEQMMRIVAGRPDGFSVLSGDDAFTLALLAAGGDGLISVASNEVPGPMSELVEAGLGGDFAHARELHYRLLPLMDANFVESNPIPVKWALGEMGRIPPGIRLPLVPLSEAGKGVVRDALRSAGVLGADAGGSR
jgi:4-hydroxy-tetrahydrodipicolinate synthase